VIDAAGLVPDADVLLRGFDGFAETDFVGQDDAFR
jgi:hypothetical protein